ncbi:MFS transporter [Tumebacillus lipolyticus]|uniref:MFS transporter n=1 Tax=Tumebacillus lipolyticus TaxID=1280370 RepID=A0ABW5A202_9BACL
MFRILKDRRILYLLTANIFSSIGSGITMIAVPWLLVNREGGDQIFGYATLFSTLILFFASPYIGVLIDRISRKKTLIFAEILGFSTVLIFALWGYLTGQFETWQLIGIHFGGSLYYSIYFPTKFAFIQELFDPEHYRSLNSMIEVQNQFATMISGGLASLFIEKVFLSHMLVLDALTYLIGMVLIILVPYQAKKGEKNGPAVSLFANIKEGFLYLKSKPLLNLYLISALMPFIGVMMGNYLFPIYVTDTLQESATVLGLSNTIYAIGAITAGLTIPFLMNRFNPYKTSVMTGIVYAIAITITALFPAALVFLAMEFFLGWGNAGIRVARNTVTMEIVPNHLIGRVSSFFNAFGMALRVSLLALFTQTIAYTGATGSLYIISGLMIAAAIGVLASGKLFNSKQGTPTEVQTVKGA